MNCKKCGSPLAADDRFCKNCGAAVEEVNAQPSITSVNESVPTQNVDNNVNNQPVNTNVNTNMNANVSNNNGNKNKNFLIIAGVAIVVIVVLCVFMVPKFLGNSNGKKESENPIGESPATPVPSSEATSFYKVNFKDFTFKIPDNLVYDVSESELLLGDEDGTWIVELSVGDGNFSLVKSNKANLQSYFQQNGFTSKPAELKNISGSEFVTLEMAESGTNMLAAYAKLNSMKIAWMITYNQDNDYDYDILGKMASIVSTATYNDASSSIAPEKKFNFNMDEISEFAQ